MAVLDEALDTTARYAPKSPWSPRKSSTTNEVTNRGHSSIWWSSRSGGVDPVGGR